ncbi:hypothetical protein D6853_01800 [Butyrivibrio sp. X503]|nr:hypothetical protein D6853_01800 [Butyrivibrio sp. X503]
MLSEEFSKLIDRTKFIWIIQDTEFGIPNSVFFQALKSFNSHFLYYAHKAKCQQALRIFLIFFQGKLSTFFWKKMAKNELIHEVIHFIHKMWNLKVNFMQCKTPGVFCALFTKSPIYAKESASNRSYKLHFEIRR